jgi:hypothetical protein
MASRGVVWDPIEPQIEKGIPAPSYNVFRFPWRKMEVGDSFFVCEDDILPSQMTKDCRHGFIQTGRYFISKATTENGIRGTRVWAIGHDPHVPIKIDKGNPVPMVFTKKRKLKIEWEKLEVGDSVTVPYDLYPRQSNQLYPLRRQIECKHNYILLYTKAEKGHKFCRIT